MSFLSLARTIVVMLLIMLPMFWVLDKYYEAEDEFHKNLLAQFEVGMKHQDVITALNQFELKKVALFSDESKENADDLELEPSGVDFRKKYGQVFHSLPKGRDAINDHTKFLMFSMWTSSECKILLGFSIINSGSKELEVPNKLALADIRCR